MSSKKSPSKKRGSSDAFAILMQKRKKPASSAAKKQSRFVECPAGCGSHVLEQNLNSHLDSCLQSNKVTTEPDDAKLNKDSEDVQQEGTSDASAAETKTVSPESNVFSHMMKQSQRLSAAKEPLKHHFHLQSDGRTLSWTEEAREEAEWSAKVLLKASRMTFPTKNQQTDSNSTLPRDVELTISSSLSSSTAPSRRLVQRHSRLSVPVLKSILQKSVRRRRPLPAVRVAMELADKSLGELLRRLPIIVLEDSTLHPDFPLLVWLMVAETKDYQVPSKLVSRVLQIVFEVASCPWTDHLGEVAPSDEPFLLSSSFHTNQECHVDTMLRSMLLRAQYGGNMKMLHAYVGLWGHRSLEPTVPTQTAERLRQGQTGAAAHHNVEWWQVPSLIHERPRVQSHAMVMPLVDKGIDKLTMQDICLEGVDFHCSAVLDHIISDNAVYEAICKQLSSMENLPQSFEQRRKHVTRVLKTCMWKFSSGVNHRRPLVESIKQQDTNDAPLKAVWDETVAPRAHDYMKKYVCDRLAPG